MAATGACLLLAAAAVFIAVRWDSLPDAAKLAVVATLTGGFLTGGWSLRRHLPATGDVAFHLGAFLLPIDVAGIGIHVGLDWRAILLAEGVTCALGLGALAAGAGSVVLTTSAGLGTIALAAGVAAVTPLPAPLLLAAAALTAHLLRRTRPAIAWATIAGIAPVLATAAAGVIDAVNSRSGLGDGVMLASGLLAAVVLGRAAGARHDLRLVALAGMCVAASTGVWWTGANPTNNQWFIALPALFVTIELVAVVVDGDAFWRRPARAIALTAEITAVPAAMIAGIVVLLSPTIEHGFDFFGDSTRWSPDAGAGFAWGLVALAWLAAAWRRQHAAASPVAAFGRALGDNRTVTFFTATAVAAIALGTANPFAVAGALAGIGATVALGGGVIAVLVAIGAAAWAPVVLGGHPISALAVGLIGAGVLTTAALRWRNALDGIATITLALAALAVMAEACVYGSTSIGAAAATTVAVVAAWGMGSILDLASVTAGRVARSTIVATVAITLASQGFGDGAKLALVVAAMATLLLMIDAVRLDSPTDGIAASASALGLVTAAGWASGLDVATTGIALCITAVVAAGLAAVMPERWRDPFLATTVAGVVAGVVLAAADPTRFAEALMLTGGLLVGSGVYLRNNAAAHAGGLTAVIGVLFHLQLSGVTASEAFLAPIALQLTVAGWQIRRHTPRPSSWVAFGPAIGMLGGAAVAERFTGGPAWHSLVAGAVGVAAVVAGGWWRLAAPLFIGTALVALVALTESLNTLAGVPTWAWLAAGGTALLAAGIALEQTTTSPIEAGRRLVDVVSERFD